jgi:hypothetical protein
MVPHVGYIRGADAGADMQEGDEAVITESDLQAGDERGQVLIPII